MYKLWTFLNDILTRKLDVSQFNLGLFIAVLVVLLIALGVCVIIMKRNYLYNKPKTKRKTKQIPYPKSNPLKVNAKNEVA